MKNQNIDPRGPKQRAPLLAKEIVPPSPPPPPPSTTPPDKILLCPPLDENFN